MVGKKRFFFPSRSREGRCSIPFRLPPMADRNGRMAREVICARVKPVHEIEHLTVEIR